MGWLKNTRSKSKRPQKAVPFEFWGSNCRPLKPPYQLIVEIVWCLNSISRTLPIHFRDLWILKDLTRIIPERGGITKRFDWRFSPSSPRFDSWHSQGFFDIAQRLDWHFSPSSPRFDSQHSQNFFHLWYWWDLSTTALLRVKWTEV